jgi:hypothetical protein|tara:strand:- start:1553 stop:1696 length:144 start_codon:yes stop_codon:yes gene_type:complete
MKTSYPPEPIHDFKEWREWITRQVVNANERRVIEDFKQSIINARTKK